MSRGPSSADLGPMIEDHGPRRSLRLRYAALMLIGGLGALAAFVYGLLRWYFAYSRYGPAVVWRWSGPAFVASLGLGILGLVGLILFVRTRRVRVTVHELGLVLERRSGRLLIPWNGVRAIYARAYRDALPWPSRRSMTQLTLDVDRLNADGTIVREPIRLTRTIDGLDELAEAIKKRVYPALMAEYSQAFNEGQALAFGPVVVASEGLRLNGRVRPWPEVGPTTLDRGRLIFEPAQASQDRRARLRAHNIPNVEVLLQLLEQVGQHR